MQKFTPEYLEAKRLKEKKRQHEYYMTVTKHNRRYYREMDENMNSETEYGWY